MTAPRPTWLAAGPARLGVLPTSPAQGPKHHLYFLDFKSYAYTTGRMDFPWTARPHAVLLFSVDGDPMRLDTGDGPAVVGSAIAVAPLTARRLRTLAPGLLSINLPPTSPFYADFRGMGSPGAVPLEGAAFRPFTAFFQRLYAGAGRPWDTELVLRDLIHLAVAQLPRTTAIDERLPRMLQLVEAEPEVSLQELAGAFGVSYHRASHLFSHSLGLPFKQFKAWQKQVRVCKLLYGAQASLTTVAYDAGLTDSAHLSRYYQQWFGQSPSYSRDRDSVRLFA